MGIIAKGARSRNGTAPTTFLRNAFEKKRGWLTQIGVLASRPAAFAVFALYAIAWITLGDGLEWHSIAVLATWGMTLVISKGGASRYSDASRQAR